MSAAAAVIHHRKKLLTRKEIDELNQMKIETLKSSLSVYEQEMTSTAKTVRWLVD